MAPRLEERKQKQEWQESALIHLCFPRLVGCFLRCVSEWPFIRPPFWSLSALRLSQYIPRCLFIIPSSVFLFLLSDLSFSHLDLPPLSMFCDTAANEPKRSHNSRDESCGLSVCPGTKLLTLLLRLHLLLYGDLHRTLTQTFPRPGTYH